MSPRILTLAIALALLAVPADAAPPQMPNEFLGWWCSTGAGQKITEYERKRCDESDGTLQVTRTGYIAWETQCTATSIRRKGRGLYSIAARCTGEGSQWNERGTWEVGRATEALLVDPSPATHP